MPPPPQAAPHDAFTAETVSHLAHLARIDLTAEDVESLTSELGAIVDMVAKVSEVITPDIVATSHPIPLTNIMRRDEVGETLSVEQALSGAPDSANGRFKVPAILDEELQ